MLRKNQQKIFFVLALFPLINSYSQEGMGISGKFLLNDNWYLQQSAKINLPGSTVSSKNLNTENWYKTKVPSTVMGVLTHSGIYENIFQDDNYEKIDKKQFDHSWWYYKQFTTPVLRKGQHVSLHFDGINYYANIWLNGKLIASRDSILGTFRRFEFDITDFLTTKGNVLAVEIFRAQPGDFNLGFVDWNQRPPDENMGIWREVYLRIRGEVGINNTYIQTKVNTQTLKEASLSIQTELKNYSSKTVDGYLKGKIGSLEFRYPIVLNANETINLKLTPEEVPSLKILNPRLWWCNNLGTPELYQLDISFESKNEITDSERITFGIREIESYTNASGYTGYKLNGKEVLIKGAGWTDDIFLRDSLESLETQVQYVKHMNLNTIRFETIWGNSQDIYDLCDKYGILAMVGWSCQWEWEDYLGTPCDDYGGIKTEKDISLIIKYLADQVIWLRNHPSIFAWVVGSDKLPRPELEKRYQQLFVKYDNRPYLASARSFVSEISGETGVKMSGPYEYVSPNYWYLDTKHGGAYGFNTETGPGPQVPVLESLRKIIPADKLWPPNEQWNPYCTSSKQAFNTMEVFNTALDKRYGKSANLSEYLLKSDVQSYEAMKAMFEAFRVNIPKTTGIIQWMLNSARPSLYWHLYDYYLIPTAAYYSARKANQPLQLIYNYGENAVYAVNETHNDMNNYWASVKLLNINSKEVLNKQMACSVKANSSTKIIDLDSISETLFLDLRLDDSNNNHVADNFYWLTNKKDESDWDKTVWYYTPMKSYADFSGLNKLPASDVKLSCSMEKKGNDESVIVRLSNPTQTTAFFLTLKLVDDQGNLVFPLFWDNNYFSMLPGETRDVECTIPKASLKGIKPEIIFTGWNVQPQRIPIH